jgi:predicted transposase YbfD/YdcC
MNEGIVNIFRRIEDPRKGNAICHDLVETLIIAILAIICGAKTFTEMEMFGKEKKEWLKTVLRLENGIPSHDTFGDIFSALDPRTITEAFVEWVETIRKKITGEVVAIDGKTIRASKDIPKNKKAVHVVSAWATQNKLVLGQLATEEKSNEITAIPKLLELLEIKDCIVTIDAMGTQTDIAEKIIEKEADYILTVKGNQEKLHENIKNVFETSVAEETMKTTNSAETTEKAHGRIEIRKVQINKEVENIDPDGKWNGLSGAAMYSTLREDLATGKIETATQYIIFSNPNTTAEQILKSKREHWGVENNLHWQLDVTYNEDKSRVRIGNAAQVLNIFRHLSLNLLSQEKTSKNGIGVKQFRCAISTDYLLTVVGISSAIALLLV